MPASPGLRMVLAHARSGTLRNQNLAGALKDVSTDSSRAIRLMVEGQCEITMSRGT
ncbi:hypothetical protein CGLAMM_08845 [Acetobacteraceae bacterium EV16G]|uniref:Uncharacterized protein n=1 Tax=Sorlinia euscelidii TaxID=3081148 RepID=A0ABU7U0U0_9PROT